MDIAASGAHRRAAPGYECSWRRSVKRSMPATSTRKVRLDRGVTPESSLLGGCQFFGELRRGLDAESPLSVPLGTASHARLALGGPGAREDIAACPEGSGPSSAVRNVGVETQSLSGALPPGSGGREAPRRKRTPQQPAAARDQRSPGCRRSRVPRCRSTCRVC